MFQEHWNQYRMLMVTIMNKLQVGSQIYICHSLPVYLLRFMGFKTILCDHFRDTHFYEILYVIYYFCCRVKTWLKIVHS
jgi:hypothetical protein